MIQAAGFIDSKLDHFFSARSQTNLSENDAISAANYKFYGAANLVQFDAKIT
jgi:hypothetical protein